MYIYISCCMQTFLYIYIFLFCFHTPCSRKDLNRYWSIRYKFTLLFPAQVLLSWIYWHKFVCFHLLLPRKYLRRVCCMCAKSPQSCQILCDSMDRSSPGSSVYRIYQARILEWVAMSYSRVSSLPRVQTCVSYVSCIGRQVWNTFFKN